MGLFSRKKKTDPVDDAAVDDASVESAPSDAASTADDLPAVDISVSTFRGVGVPSASRASADGTPDGRPADSASADPAPRPASPPRPSVPRAPAAPPTELETVPGLRDNALLRDALGVLTEKPTGAEVLGILRQMLQGHLYLRVKGDAQQQIAAGQPVTFGVARVGDKKFMLVYSSGRALREAVQSDGDDQTSAVAQPVGALLTQLLGGDYDGMIVDNSSQPRRVVLPREILQQAMTQADEQFRLKALIAAPREADTPRRVASLLAEGPAMWVAVGAIDGDDARQGVAEARLADGTRLIQLHSHPLEVVAQGRGEKAMPMTAERLGAMLREHPELGGVLIDPAGPLITLTRDELAPVMALAG